MEISPSTHHHTQPRMADTLHVLRHVKLTIASTLWGITYPYPHSKTCNGGMGCSRRCLRLLGARQASLNPSAECCIVRFFAARRSRRIASTHAPTRLHLQNLHTHTHTHAHKVRGPAASIEFMNFVVIPVLGLRKAGEVGSLLQVVHEGARVHCFSLVVFFIVPQIVKI